MALVASQYAPAANDYTQHGPYEWESQKTGMRMEPSTGCRGRQCSMTVTVTRPQLKPGEGYAPDRKPPFPIVFFLNGFQMVSTYYKDYVELLTSWGYVTVQYDLPAFVVPTDSAEVRYLQQMLDWLEGQHNTIGTFVHGLIDMERMAVSGHSRGAKLAALHLAQNPKVKTAYLIDPVDSDKRFRKESVENPSAVRALATGSGWQVGIVGAEKVGSCNPVGANYENFWAAVGNGSWLTVVSNSSHSQFLKAPPLAAAFFNFLCGTGGTSAKDVILATRPGLVAWMEGALYQPCPSGAASSNGGASELRARSYLDAFFQWVQRMEMQAVLKFIVKEPAAPAVDAEDPQMAEHVNAGASI